MSQDNIENTGYELFLGPERVGHEPEYSKAQSIEHFRWYVKKSEKTIHAKAYYNGTELILDTLN